MAYYLQNLNAGYVGNSPLLWHKGDRGYTPDLDQAKLFSRDEARAVIRGTKGTHHWRMISEKDANAAAYRTIDVQHLPGLAARN